MHPLSESALFQTLQEFLQVDSTTGREGKFLESLEKFLTQAGFETERQPVEAGRWNLFAKASTRPRVLFSTHVDTVPPFLPVEEREDRIFGRGACDTKGGIMAMLQAGLKLLQEGQQDFGYLFVVGEEVDHCGAQAARKLSIDVDRIILCEPTGNRVVEAQKGMLRAVLQSQGRAGHSAFPDAGESAIHHLLDALDQLRKEAWPSHPRLGPTTLNIGRIEGGVAGNVFAPDAKAELVFRAVSDASALEKRVKKLVSPQAELTVLAKNDPVFFDPPESVATCVVPFNTDASYLNELAPIWLVGPGEIEFAHSDKEHITKESLLKGIELYEYLAKQELGAFHRS